MIDAAVPRGARAAQAERHELDISIEPGIDEFVADGPRVTQILYNLLSNAIGFSPSGGKIALICRRENAMVAFTVEDQGVGIPEEYQKAVFDRFESRPHGSRHRGAGLGLSIVKSLAELHGGTVDALLGAGTGHARHGAAAAHARAQAARSEGRGPVSTSRATSQAAPDERQLES